MQDSSAYKRKVTAPGAPARGKRRQSFVILNVLVAVLLLAVGYFSYLLLQQSDGNAASIAGAPAGAAADTAASVVQLDILNGCGVKGIGMRFTNYLRLQGFDVVEMRNYKTFGIPKTLVVDRVGNLTNARRVAAALGLDEESVIQQINPDYFVDVSVIIGKDYAALQPTLTQTKDR